MVNIDSLPNEQIFQILQHPDLCRSDLEAAGKTCQRWSVICDDIMKKKGEEAAEISDSWVNTFRLWRDETYPDNSCKLVVEYIPPMSQVASAAALARQGFLTSVRSLALVNLDITCVPAEDMAKLVECVTESVYIENLRGDVTSVFSNINCVVLAIDKMSLSPVDTQALVSAMDTRVDEVHLYKDVTLDLETLTQYDGTGNCGFLRTENGFGDVYKVIEWVGKMEMNWGAVGKLLVSGNYIDISRGYDDDITFDSSDTSGEDEESFEMEEDALNSDDEGEDELNSDSEEEAEVDSGKNNVKEDLQTTKEQNHHQDDDEDDEDAAAGSAGQYFVDQATGQYYFQFSNGDMVQLEDTADTGVGGGGILDQEEDVPYKR